MEQQLKIVHTKDSVHAEPPSCLLSLPAVAFLAAAFAIVDYGFGIFE
jgi:hypothetical protein